MSLLLISRRLSKLCLGKTASKYSLLSKGFSSSSSSSSSSVLQSPPCEIVGAYGHDLDHVRLIIWRAGAKRSTYVDKEVPLDLVYNDINNEMVTIGSSHGWVASMKKDNQGILCLHDDLNPVASEINPKRISFPPFETLPFCQTQIITNVSMSKSSPEDEDCVLAVKFLGPQLSFFSNYNYEWTNIKLEHPCFFSSRVMFSKKHQTFRILGGGGHVIGSWYLDKHEDNPEFKVLTFQNLPEMTKEKRELLDSCCTTHHLVESPDGETFLVKWYKKHIGSYIVKRVEMKTIALMVFKVDDYGFAVYTQDIGDLVIFLSKCEPFCVPASSFQGMKPNMVEILDVDESGIVNLEDSSIDSDLGDFKHCPYHIPPQDIV